MISDFYGPAEDATAEACPHCERIDGHARDCAERPEPTNPYACEHCGAPKVCAEGCGD